jgi:predicted enzyme related to lactoylglutathione lyase
MPPTSVHGKICYLEIPTDPARSVAFYQAVFGWKVRRNKKTAPESALFSCARVTQYQRVAGPAVAAAKLTARAPVLSRTSC